MTTFEALVSISQIALRARGEWHGGATAHDDIDFIVNRVSDLMPEGSRQLCEMAIAELKRRGATRDDALLGGAASLGDMPTISAIRERNDGERF